MTVDSPDKTANVLQDVKRLKQQPCRICGTAIAGDEAVMSIVLGYKNAPRCLPCLATEMREEPLPLRARLWQYVQRHDCYLRAWNWACRVQDKGEKEAEQECQVAIAQEMADRQDSEPTTVDSYWHAGEMSCG